MEEHRVRKLFLLLFLVLCPLFAYAKVFDRVVEKPYDITGKTVADLQKAMKKHKLTYYGTPVDAAARWYVYFNYKFDRGDTICKVRLVSVSLDIEYEFPNWKDMAAADTALQAKWQLYLDSLRARAKGHIEFGYDAAQDVDEMLETYPPFKGDCDDLKEKLNAAGNKMINEYSKKTREYEQQLPSNTFS
jgi:predicted secreted Zn-dependent protease